MGESRVSSGRGCRSANGDRSLESIWTVESVGEDSVRVSRNVGKGTVGCGDGGGVLRFKWLVIAASIISTAVSSASVMVGVVVGVVMLVVGRGRCRFFAEVVVFLYIFWCSIGHRR